MTVNRRSVAAAAVYLGTFMASLAISIVSVALPAIQSDLGIGLSGLQWVVGTYTLCLSAFMLSAGPLADRYGRKRIWLIGVALFTVGSAVCASAHSLETLIAGCALQGVAGALVIPGALSILTQAFPDPAERAHVIGGWSSFSAVSLILGPMLGGLLVDHAGWASIFLVNLPIGMVTISLGLLGIEESANPEHAALDPAGQFLSIAFLGSLTFALINAGNAGWYARETIFSLLTSSISLVLFIVVELRASRPVFPVDLFRQAPFASANFASLVLGFSGYTSLFLFSLFLQQGQGWTATDAGWRMAPVFAAMLFASSIFGKLSRRFGMNRLMIAGYIILGVSMLAMTSFTPTTPYWIVAPAFTLLGIALGVAVPATGAAAMGSAPRERTGAASATMNALRQGGMTIGIALLGTIMSTRATASLEGTLTGSGSEHAATLAAVAVQRHEMPVGLSIAPETFQSLLKEASTHGFASAAMVAGALGLVATLVLAVSAYRTARRRSSASH
ncbi:DHA2 family efflux MFS transporter permease subunit [Rhizobium lusitanum]|uniref:EmrB/QacA subfamily drug resistance transporter n=1 Tax=Rhizobium lusitanum TaxID=293958 RepID=A0A7X0MCG2_9HYPH|nr:DHA2 family efflux MFS transporter permease subunit [Rhizobium lusitanum]MBB6485782.1 EmrB/QacA subfamily drug resistance transporter [Rhizobium lusitanum]